MTELSGTLLAHPLTGALAAVRTAGAEGVADDLWRFDDAALLEVMAEAQSAIARVEALRLTVLAEIDRRRVTEREFGIDTASWLRATRAQSIRTARRDVAVATGMTRRFGATRQALAGGAVSVEQAVAVVRVLEELPPECNQSQVAAAESTMIGFARQFDPHALGRLSRAVVEVVAPEVADEAEEKRLIRQEREARRTRYLRWTDDGHGALFLSAKFPTADGERIRHVVEAIAAHDDVGADVEGSGDRRSLEQRRADALLTVGDSYLQQALGPEHGGDRPRVTVLLDLEVLRRGLGPASLLDGDEAISAAEARRLACDADLIPAVLGSSSEVLDLGRQRRLFGGTLRHALALRDRGCVFPGCDRPPRACDAHHLVPWWSGGPTSLDNGALLCPRHHRLVEPDACVPEHEQWQLRMSADGVPEAIPPAHVDAECRPWRHHRHR